MAEGLKIWEGKYVSMGGAQRAKFTKKVDKPTLGVNVIDFELNGFNAFIWVPWSTSGHPKM